MAEQKYPTGGEFLLSETAPQDVFTPEDFDENQRMFAATVEGFVEKHYQPLVCLLYTSDAADDLQPV